MQLTKKQKGEAFLWSEALLWSFFPIISILAFSTLSPLFTASISTGIAAVFFTIVLGAKNQWKQMKKPIPWFDILMATLFVGVLFYFFLFIGLQQTTAGNASILLLSEVFFTMVILGPIWKKERLTKRGVLGAVLMVLGVFITVFKGSFIPNKGDLLIILATAMPPVGNYFAKRARGAVSSEFILLIRSLISGLVLFIAALLFYSFPTGGDLIASLPFLLINGVLLLGLSKIFWFEAIHRIDINRAIALNSIIPAFTLIFAFLILKEIPSLSQVLGFIPIAIGVWLITEFRSTQN